MKLTFKGVIRQTINFTIKVEWIYLKLFIIDLKKHKTMQLILLSIALCAVTSQYLVTG